MNNKSEKPGNRLLFARLNFAAEVEPCSFKEWIKDHRRRGTILKKVIGDRIVELSFKGIAEDHNGSPAFWEVSKYKRHPLGVVRLYEYSSEDDAIKSFWDFVERYHTAAD